MNDELDEALRKYAERAQSFSGQFGKWSELEVKRYLVEPLLTALLWDPTDPNSVRHEFPVTMGSETRNVDYALMSADASICVVEAKAGELDEAAARQALSYARNLDVRWAIVTNGQRLCLYGVEFYASENTSSALVMDVAFAPESIDASLGLLRYLASGTLDSDDVYDVFNALNERRALLTFLQREKDALVKVIARWTEEHWGKGPVDEPLLVSSLEGVFESVERTEERPPEARASTSGLDVVVAGDWRHRPSAGRGVFELKSDPAKRIDVSLPASDVERRLEGLGFRLSSPTAIGGFYWSLRTTAGLKKVRGT